MFYKLDDLLKELIEEYGIYIPKDAIIEEPNNSLLKLLKYEKVNKTNTIDIVSGKYLLRDNPEVIQDWIYHYERFIDFGGDINKINTQ